MNVNLAELKNLLTPLQFSVSRALVISSQTALIIGGAIRDFYFSYPVDDVDFLVLEKDTHLGIKKVIQVLEDNLSKDFPSLKVSVHTPLTPYRTAKIKVEVQFDSDINSQSDCLIFDISFPRKETYEHPASKPKVSEGALLEDFMRRDFSINAIAFKGDLKKGNLSEIALYDPLGGYQDILDKKLRILHSDSFRDDPIRLVRAERFLNRYSCTFEYDTKVCSEDPELISILSKVSEGRRVQEFYKILFEARPFEIIDSLMKKDYLDLLFPGITYFNFSSEEYNDFESYNSALLNLPKEQRLLAYLMSKLEFLKAKHLMQYIPISKEERKRVFSFL